MIRYILFDMDGLMVDSERATFDLLKEIREKYGFSLDLATYSRNMGQKIDEYSRKNKASVIPPEIRKKIDEEWTLRFYELAENGKIPAKPGLFELLDYCDAHGIRKVVVSSSIPRRVHALLNSDHIIERVDGVIDGSSVTKSKPDPQPYLLGAALVHAGPSECLVLEDSINGIESGHNAGMKVIWIPDLGEPDEEHASLCAAVLPSLLEVRDWLDKENHD